MWTACWSTPNRSMNLPFASVWVGGPAGARRAVLDHARSATGRVRARAAEPLGLSPAEICDGLDAAAEALMEAELVGIPHARAAVELVAADDRRVGLAVPAAEQSPTGYCRHRASPSDSPRSSPTTRWPRQALPGDLQASCVPPRDSPQRAWRSRTPDCRQRRRVGWYDPIAVPNRYTSATELAQADAVVSDLD
jgi:hypothetical protein